MYVVFGWGESPSADDMKYTVLQYQFSVSTMEGDTRPANCVPGEIDLTLELPPTPNPAQDFLNFATQQHTAAAEEGAGKIAVYKGKDAGESIQEVSFKQGWIVDIGLGAGMHDEMFTVTLRIAASEVTVSGVNFIHNKRKEHFKE